MTPATTVAPWPAISPPTTAAAVAGPLRVVRHTWAQNATLRGTPLEAGPEGLLPVSAVAGAEERASYVKLEGSEASLTLAVHEGTDAGDFGAELASIVACPIISADWAVQDGQSFASAPAHDPARRVEGTPAADGTSWTWDLSGYADRGTSAGFALVSAPDGAGTWQLTFEPTGP